MGYIPAIIVHIIMKKAKIFLNKEDNMSEFVGRDYDWLVAANINNWVYIDHEEWDREDPYHKNPEQLLISKEKKKLSQEAIQVINIILNSPSEVINTFKSKSGKKINKTKIYDYIRKELGWQWKTIWAVAKEIKEWLYS